ncbi:MAG: hypothetical protein SVE93_05645 [Candidatus Thermoplasmatota archaeon]|nr:hypothetical protein [Candidatus Thermoplasmatota archaeon]
MKNLLIFILTRSCELFAIDAPLFFETEIKTREADRTLKRYGAMPPEILKDLSLRGTALAKALINEGKEVIEVFPTATSKILSVWEKDRRKTARKLGIKVRNKHELDAYLCALTGKLWVEDKAIAVGDDEGKIVIPNGSPLS